MQCTDLKMGSPQARKSKRRPKVPVKAIPMSLKGEEARRGRGRSQGEGGKEQEEGEEEERKERGLL